MILHILRAIRDFLCGLWGHKFTVWQEFGPVSRRVICPRCGGDWAMHDGTRTFVPWDGEFARMYREHGHTLRSAPPR